MRNSVDSSVHNAQCINNPSAAETNCSHWYSEACIITILFTIVLSIFFYPAVWQNKLIYSGDLTGSDLLELNIPRRALAAAAVRDGEIPLWEPKLGSGICLLAEGQSAPFYPTTLPLYLTLTLTQATNISILSTLLFAMLGSYALSRSYSINPIAACFGALAFGLGGIFIFRLKHLNMIQAIAWLPWSLFALRTYWLTERRKFLIVLGASWILQILAGHPHACYICWLTSYIYALGLYWEQRRQPHSRRTWYHLLGVMLAVSSISVLLCSVQLLPTWELTKYSTRSGSISWDNLHLFPFKFKHLTTLINPFYFGSPATGSYFRDIGREGIFWENTPYFGILPLILSLAAVLRSDSKRKIYPLAVLTLFFLWSALGPSWGVYCFFWKLCPFFNLFRFPARMLIPAICFAAILAAWGLHHLCGYLHAKYNKRTAVFIGLLFLFLTAADLFRINRLYQSFLPADWQEPPAALRMLSDKMRIYAPTYIYTWELVNQRRGWLNNEDKICFSLNSFAPDLAAVWGIDCPSDRIVFDGGNELWHYFDGQAWQLSNINSSIQPEANGEASFDIYPGLVPWLRLQSISHIVSFLPIRQAGANPAVAKIVIYKDPQDSSLPPLYIYALRDPLPKTRLIDPHLTLELPEFAQFIRDNYPTYQAGSLYEPNIGSNPSIGTADILHEGHNYLTISTECSRDSFLIVSNTYHPNWRISIDDSPPVPVTRVNYAFQGAPIPAGRHRVTLRFASPAFDLGWKISAATLLALLALWGWSSFRNRPHFG